MRDGQATSARPYRASDLQGLKYFQKIRPLFEPLHEIGCGRDRAGNRELHMDEYCVLVLMWLFNPVLTSLRGLQQASELEEIGNKFGVGPVSLGSLSESVNVFDSEPLKAIAAQLAAEIPSGDPTRFDGIGRRLTAVDGSVFNTAVRVAKLAWLPKAKNGQVSAYRWHTHFEILRGLPTRIDVTPANPRGEHDERAVLARTLAADHCYIIDRGYAKFELFNQIHALGSSYVCRARDNSVPEGIEDRPLSAADRAVGVISDREVRLGASATNPHTKATDHRLRLIEIKVQPHVRIGGKGVSSDGVLRLFTNLMEPPAELIAETYKQRWLIELFFRMIKQLLGCRHLLSTKQTGVEIQAYMAIIACLLILSHTGRQPNKRTFEMISFYLLGWASLTELEAHLETLERRPV